MQVMIVGTRYRSIYAACYDNYFSKTAASVIFVTLERCYRYYSSLKKIKNQPEFCVHNFEQH